MNTLPSEAAAVVAVIDPDANAAGALTSAYVSMSDFESIQAIILSGTMGTSGTLDAKLVQATDSSGTGVKDITGKAITQMVKATNDDDQAVINCRAEELDAANGFDHVALVLTTAVATGDSAAVVMGHNPRFAPASDNDLASVVEIVS